MLGPIICGLFLAARVEFFICAKDERSMFYAGIFLVLESVVGYGR
jgi:hypothetical protein